MYSSLVSFIILPSSFSSIYLSFLFFLSSSTLYSFISPTFYSLHSFHPFLYHLLYPSIPSFLPLIPSYLPQCPLPFLHLFLPSVPSSLYSSPPLIPSSLNLFLPISNPSFPQPPSLPSPPKTRIKLKVAMMVWGDLIVPIRL